MARRIIIMFFLSSMAFCFGMSKFDYDEFYQKQGRLNSRELITLGSAYIKNNHIDSAMAVYALIANRYEELQRPEDKEYAIMAYNGLGVICFMKSNYTAAYSYFTSANELDTRAYAPGNLNLSAIYLYYGEKEKAYTLMRNVLDAAIADSQFYIASVTLLNLLSPEIDESVQPVDSVESLISFYNENVRRTPENTAWELADHMANARLYYIKGLYADAIEALRRSVNATEGMLSPSRNLFYSFKELGKTFAAAGKTDSALFYFDKAVNIAQEHHYSELLMSAYADLSDLFTRMGNRQLADEYRYRRLNINDSIFTASEFGKIHDLELFHQASRFEKRITRITLEKAMHDRMLVIVSSALFLLMVMLTLILRQNQLLKRKNKSLFERNMAEMKAQKAKVLELPATDSPEVSVGESDGMDEEESAKYASSALSEEKAQALERRIREVMSQEDIFCRDGFSLHDLAEQCSSNTKYVSQVLNERMGCSFSQYLNECRVSVARKRFVDFEHYGHLTIEAIVAELGFKSRSTFSKTFKRITGLSPSEFQRLAREN